MKEFSDKVALVTGGSSGIGKATVLAFARKGAKVASKSRREQESEELVASVKFLGGEAIFVQTDIRKAADVEDLISKTVSVFGRLDFAFNNAGIEGKPAPGIEQTEEDWDNVIDTNLKGVWLSMKYEIPQMLRQGGGVIVRARCLCFGHTTHSLLLAPRVCTTQLGKLYFGSPLFLWNCLR